PPVAEGRLGGGRKVFATFPVARPPHYIPRGDVDEARRGIHLVDGAATWAGIQERQSYQLSMAMLHLATGNHGEALKAAEDALSYREAIGESSENIKESFIQAVEAAFGLGDEEKTEALLASIEQLPRGTRPPFLEAQTLRFRGRLSAARGELGQVEGRYKAATGMCRELAI